ncbi:phospho-N-acetylmuramoyl-pentapeptide-transferase [Buchnera aphidicola (Melanaphis sacchari)]|uniref:Phospho-N-acetylmuramoyl-pentapeptide-transferase n=1 Tax=Buchnera aphidicola (Melanaphis sacchari) TaxID=2173854 RepID=A0A2U8DH39_9GAMM|nr:phospho-N-acetylmuramoyl-pentapeptide-transferase [Buchnera aphidicola]AWH90554.1 phospho-N-acetylmuramoyl-pentapeptide-transferase [Buchnera aphidicola (Melanaphis sacchari)]
MFLWISEYFNCKLKILYFIPYRIIFSLLTSFFINLFIIPKLIFYFHKSKKYQIIRKNGPINHILKKNTPTMGGILIIFSILISIFLYCDLFDIDIWYIILILVGYGLIGFLDDYKKIRYKNSCGLKILWKFFLLSTIAVLIIYIINHNNYSNNIQISIPFYSIVSYKFNYLYIFLSYLVIVGTSNAVNLTDGLDGLAIMPIIFLSCALGLISFFSSNIYFCQIMNVVFLKNASELVILCSAIIGSGLGFLWFNAHPSQIFMGDVGSLPLGGSLGVIAILLHQEFLLFFLGGIFVIETISVILQVIYFKITKKRIFKMSPIHHHYEIKGVSESLIIVRFWIISLLLLFIAIVSLRVHINVS